MRATDTRWLPTRLICRFVALSMTLGLLLPTATSGAGQVVGMDTTCDSGADFWTSIETAAAPARATPGNQLELTMNPRLPDFGFTIYVTAFEYEWAMPSEIVDVTNVEFAGNDLLTSTDWTFANGVIHTRVTTDEVLLDDFETPALIVTAEIAGEVTTDQIEFPAFESTMETTGGTTIVEPGGPPQPVPQVIGCGPLLPDKVILEVPVAGADEGGASAETDGTEDQTGSDELRDAADSGSTLVSPWVALALVAVLALVILAVALIRSRRSDTDAATTVGRDEPLPGDDASSPFTGTDDRSRSRVLIIVLALLAAAIVVALLVWWAFIRDTGPDHPDAWDPLVVEYVDFVEEARGLEFQHPVHVDWLAEDEFSDEVTTDEEDLTAEEREETEQFEGLFRALGLLPSDLDLFEEVNRTSDSLILAFYNQDDDRVTVNGERPDEIDAELAVTIVHELTHVLQDQHFDLARTGDFDTDGENAAFRTVVEGDASRVERAYREQLDEDDAAALTEGEDASLEEIPDDLPSAIVAFQLSEYLLGEGFTTLVRKVGGDEAVDDALENPPLSEEQVFNPWTYLDGDDPIEVDIPELDDDEESIADGDFGVITLYVMLAERIDPQTALEAADGWGGDAYVMYEADGTTCVQVAMVGNDDADTDTIHAALDEWSANLPGDASSVSLSDGEIHLMSCDPGQDVELEMADLAVDAVSAAARRIFESYWILEEVVPEGTPNEGANCFARTVARELTYEELLSQEPISEDRGLELGTDAEEECFG